MFKIGFWFLLSSSLVLLAACGTENAALDKQSLTLGIPSVPCAEDSTDFTQDGIDDFIAGHDWYPNGTPPTNSFVGALSLQRGSPTGLTVNAYQELSTAEDINKIFSTTYGQYAGQRIGSFLTTGDYNNDGFCDLVLTLPPSYPSDDPPEPVELALGILYGNQGGFDFESAQRILSSELKYLPSWSELHSKDFNNDGYVDLAYVTSSVVTIIYGSSDGLLPKNAEIIDSNTLTNDGTKPSSTFAAETIRSGDFNNDGYIDIATATRGAPLEGKPSSVTVIFGSSKGWVLKQKALTYYDLQIGHRYNFQVLDSADFNQDGYDDLVLGSSLYSYSGFGNSYNNPEALTVIYGSKQGLGYSTIQKFQPKIGTSYRSPAVGDFNHDGYPDLAAIVRELNNGSGSYNINKESVIKIWNGSPKSIKDLSYAPKGLNPKPKTLSFPDTDIENAVPAPSYWNRLGVVDLGVGDFNGDGIQDLLLAVSLYHTDRSAATTAILFGEETDGLTTQNAQWLYDNGAGVSRYGFNLP